MSVDETWFLAIDLTEQDKESKAIFIPIDLYASLEGLVKDRGFLSVDDFVVYVLKVSLGARVLQGFTPEDEEHVKARLRALGYV